MKSIWTFCLTILVLLWVESDLFAQPPVYGSGTPNYLAKFTSSNPAIIGQSVIYDNGMNVGIGSMSLTLGRLVVSNNSSDNIAWFSGNNSAMVVVNNTNEAEFVGRDAANTAYRAISFRANSSPGQLYLTTSGNVGIGTTSPGQKLSVTGTIESTTGGFKFPDGTVQTTAASGGGGGSSLWIASGSNIYSSNSGNVGIGTNTPSSRLEVLGDTKLGHYVMLKDYDSGNWNGSYEGTTLISRDFTTMFLNGGVVVGGYNNGSVPSQYGVNGAFLTTGPVALAVNTGNVGIGTTTPGQKLSVAGTIESTTGGFKFPDGSVQTTASSGGAPPHWNLNGSGDIYNSNTGKVGIGTMTPAQRLDVAGTIGISGTAVIDANRNLNAVGGSFSGNVGIGTASPSQKLDVNGAIGIAGNSFVDISRNVTAGSGTFNGTVWSTSGGFKFPDGTLQTTSSKWTTNTNDIYSTNTGYVGIGRIPTQKLDVAGSIGIFGTSVIDGSRNLNAYGGTFSGNVSVTGNVIVGNRPSTSYKLDVTGNIRANEVVVNTDGSDFVFEESYKLMELTALAKYVKENKHLPDISSANEMQKGGVGVGDMQTKLLQKIEELTLYVIQQDKRIEKLEKENAEMRHGGH